MSHRLPRMSARDFLAAASRLGWRMRKSRGCHILVYPPSGRVITVSNGHSDEAVSPKAIVELRKAAAV